VYDPTYKRGKAKKLSYQYKGPFEIEQRISPLIYKVRMADCSSAILHIIRLKKAYEQTGNDNVVPPSKDTGRMSKQERKKVPKENIEAKLEELEEDVSPRSGGLNIGGDESE
jgi:hypothetical protein